MITSQEFWDILANMPLPKLLSWRLYYDEQGAPVCYSMEELPGNYIEIDAETYARSPRNVRVIDGQLHYIHTVTGHKLVPGPAGVACDPRDVAVIVDDTQPHQRWSRRHYESS